MVLASTTDSPIARRLVTLAIGLLLVAIGVALMITAELGVAPFDVLTTGLAATTGLEIGVAAMILPLLFVLLGWALGGRLGPGTAIAVVVVGPVLGVVLDLLPDQVETMAPRLALFAVGFVVISAGITGVVIAEIGPGPAELVMLAIHERGHPLAPVRTGIEAASVTVGWIMGGQIGAGTVVVALLIGPTLRWMLTISGYSTTRAVQSSSLASPGT